MLEERSLRSSTWTVVAMGLLAACSSSRVSRLVDDDEPIRRAPSDASSDAAIAGGLEAEGGSTASCGEWSFGSLTGYDNSDFSDDPNAGSVMEYTGLTSEFYDNVAMAAVDMSDWNRDKYRWIDVDYNGVIGRVGVWDACHDDDCPDGRKCCTENKVRHAQPGYLVDLETRTAKRLFGVSNAENTLNVRVKYRVCGGFNPDAIARRYGTNR